MIAEASEAVVVGIDLATNQLIARGVEPILRAESSDMHAIDGCLAPLTCEVHVDHDLGSRRFDDCAAATTSVTIIAVLAAGSSNQNE